MKRAALFLGVAAIILAFLFAGPLDYGLRYAHYKTLTKQELVSGARIYIQNRTNGRQLACLYAVACDGDEARLVLIDDPVAWNFDESKQSIWRRRFEDFCPGRTTNFGLQLVPIEEAEPAGRGTALARWSFFNDRFIPNNSRVVQSGSFSDQPWEECTPEKALRF